MRNASMRGGSGALNPVPARSPQHPAEQRQRMIAARPAQRRRDLLLDLPIAWRLTIGFLLAALIAAAASGVPALQRAQALSNESSFYESLLRSNTSLTTGNSFLELMNTTVHQALADATVSHESLATDENSAQGLANRYDAILTSYTHGNLLEQHPDQVAILTEANHTIEVTQQQTLASSALRTWQFYRDAQGQVLQDIASNDLAGAQTLEREQAEPTNADALSALRALIQFDGRVASSIHDASVVEQQGQITTALIAALIAFVAVAAVGWVISNTLVRRLGQLRKVTQLVEQGQLDSRVTVVGRDEIAGVSASVNGMLDTIVGLLDVTRRQRDALTNAAERLFADMRVAGAGDLRVSAAVSGDPIGMLGNAFNFTVGRFRRFVLRTQTSADQLDIVGRQQLDRAEYFLHTMQQFVRSASTPSQPSGSLASFEGIPRARSQRQGHVQESANGAAGSTSAKVELARDVVRQVAREGANYHSRAVLDLAEQAYLSAGRLSQLTMTALNQQHPSSQDEILQAQLDELRTLGTLLARLGTEAHAIQKNTGAKLMELDTALEELAATAQAAPQTRSAGAASAPTMGNAQTFEFVRLAGGFAQDVAALARQILMITQEMRAGLAPFRLEAGDSGNAQLYAPGTGYQEPTVYETFGRDSAPSR